MLNERLAQLLSRKLAGEATSNELEELHQYLQAHQDDQYFAELLSIYWNNHQDKKDEKDEKDQQFQLILDLAKEKTDVVPIFSEPPKRTFSIWKIAVAAMLTGAIITSYFLWIRKPVSAEVTTAPGSSHKQNEIEAKAGARSHVLLPDGSQVWLNSASKLTYAESFNDSTREVKLEGEGYFNIVKDASRPFIVHTGGIDVRVLGTTFNLKSYPQESTVEAVLLRGMLEVTNTTNPNSPKVILKPHEKIVFKKQNKEIIKSEDKDAGAASFSLIPSKEKAVSPIPRNIADSAIIETAWVYNKLRMEAEQFEEVALKMERWFNVTIQFKSEKVKRYKITATFSNENVQQALEALKLIHSFDYKINNNEVEIYAK
jgi:transmembrane sensor